MGSIWSTMGHAWLGPMTALAWTELAIAFLAALALSLVVERAVLKFLPPIVPRGGALPAARISEFLRGPARALSALVLFRAFQSPIDLAPSVEAVLQKVLAVAFILATGWSLHRGGRAVVQAVERRREQASRAPAEVAAIRTQLLVAERILSVLVFAITGALALLQFDVVRNVGVSLLASAGVAGVVVGFAAQRSLGTLLAGIQLSITQPIRIGDAVELQKELGFVEDIRLSYVVVRLWDGRRLIVPTPKFLEEPLVNLTKGAEELLGTVEWRVDLGVSVALAREAFQRAVATDPRWDGKVSSVEVTDVGEKSITLRGLVSARSPGDLWALRVAVREKLVDWLRQPQGGNAPPRDTMPAAMRQEPTARPQHS